MQLIAGNVLDGLLDQFAEGSDQRNAAKSLVASLSFFELNSPSHLEQPVLAQQSFVNVLMNALQRGTPTWLNAKALEIIAAKSQFIELHHEEYGIKLHWKNKIKGQEKVLLDSLHIVDPRVTTEQIATSWKSNGYELGSHQEMEFFFNSFSGAFGKASAAFLQMLVPQRTLNSILKNELPAKLPAHVRTDFEQQRSDFSIEFPYFLNARYKGVVVEIDGRQHLDVTRQIYLDSQRDEVLAQIGWHNTIRIPTSNIAKGIYHQTIETVFKNAVKSSYVTTTLSNYESSLLKDPLQKELLELATIPFAIGRIQMTILQLIAAGKLKMDALEWKIAVIERDVPCAAIAMSDLEEALRHLNVLCPELPVLPRIELTVYNSPEFSNSPFQLSNCVYPINSFANSIGYDCILDISVLQRDGVLFPVSSISPVYSIRSAHFTEATRKVFTSAHISYSPLAHKTIDEQWEINKEREHSVTYFLQSFFRKSSFRPGQIPIINKALQAKSVIGLLPTGGGKSITYQISALLQPGVCLVIDPIRSLMKDQVDGLLDNQINSAVFINSTLKGKDKTDAIKKMVSGQAQFIFISPERLQMGEFRDLLKKMYEDKIFFNYCVIDEAHCVSEWGHDFRTAYLRLGVNTYTNCKTFGNIPVPLFGLTATASYDVLADIQRELSAYGSYKLDEDALVRFESSIRPEIQFVIEDVTLRDKNFKDEWKLKAALGEAKRKRIMNIFDNLPSSVQSFHDNPKQLFSDKDWEEDPSGTQKRTDTLLIPNYDKKRFFTIENAGLIFCPHKSGPYGITDAFKPVRNGEPVNFEGVYDFVRERSGISAGFFMGAGDEQDETAKTIVESSIANQTLFKKNKLNLMVATKAFGMGIDKPNIRYTIHFNYPGSIESFVQEAGRAGRDRDIAISYLLFNHQQFNIEKTGETIDHDLNVNFYFHNNSFKGVSKEMAVLDELLTEIFFPDRTSEIEKLLEAELEIEVQCTYWEGSVKKMLFVNKGYKEGYCAIDLTNLTGNTKDSVDATIGNSIISVVTQYIKDLHLTIPAFEWIQKSEKEVGIEKRLERLRDGDNFEIEVGFINNHLHRVQTLSQWLKLRVHNSFDIELVKKLRKECNNSDTFIEKIIENYKLFTSGNELDFRAICSASDKAKGNPVGYAYRYFSNLFNAYRNKQDTEKAIYRLTTLGIIDDYTVDFNSQTFTLLGTKKPDKAYKERLESYLQKFYSEKVAKQKLKEVEKIDEPTYLRKCLRFIISFVYDSIKSKRANGIKEMKEACLQTIEKREEGNLFLREYIDLYFNSKYARFGYSFVNGAGKTILASLTDLTEEGRIAKLKTVWDFSEYIDQDNTGTPLENTKHLRGACVRLITNSPDNYTLRLLNAFALFMLEYRNKRMMQEAIAHVTTAFEIIESQEHLSDKELEKIFDKYYKLVCSKNEALIIMLAAFDLQLDFESIMISRTLKRVQILNKTLRAINKNLLENG